MKQFTAVSLALFINLFFVFCQSEYKAGDKIMLGNGTSANGDFKYIYAFGNEQIYLPQTSFRSGVSGSEG